MLGTLDASSSQIVKFNHCSVIIKMCVLCFFFECSTHDTMPAQKSNGSKGDSSDAHVSKRKKKMKNDDDTGAVEKSGLKEAHANVTGEIETDTQSTKKKKKKHQTLDSVINCDDDKIATEAASEKLQKSKKKKKQNSDTEDSLVKTTECKKRKRVSADDESDQTNDDDAKLKEAGREESATKKTDSNPGATDINDDVNSNNGDKSSGRKSAKKPRNGSGEVSGLNVNYVSLRFHWLKVSQKTPFHVLFLGDRSPKRCSLVKSIV